MYNKVKLLLFPTPIYAHGEIDIPPKVKNELLPIKYMVVERTRTTRRFLKRIHPDINIDEITFIEMDKHHQKLDKTVLEWLQSGYDVGLLSEAGLPCIADPGYRYVDLAHRHGIQVIPFSGPNSILLALMASGFSGQHFEFHGYLPRDQDQLKAELISIERSVRKSGKTHIYMETPYRNLHMIEAISLYLMGDTQICIAVDISSPDEHIYRSQVKDVKNAKSLFNEKRPAIFIIGQS